MPPVTLKWYDGGLRPPRPEGMAEGRRGFGGDGIYFVGEDGVIACGGWAGTPRIIPESKMRLYTQPPKTIPRLESHHRDWIDACKGGKAATSNFDYSGPMTEAIMLGNVAVRSRRKILWDSKNLKAINAPEVEGLIKPVFREGWGL